jgi:putative transposase
MDGVDYLVEGRQGSDLALFNTLTGETLTMTYSAVMRRAGLSDVPMDNVDKVRAAEDKLPPLQKARKDLLTPHVEEVAYGKPLDAETHRPEYDPATTTQDERLDRKVAELSPLNIRGTSRSNLKKLVYKLKGQETTGLVDGRSIRVQGPFDNIDPRLYSLMVRRVNAARDDSTASMQQLITEICGEWADKHPNELDMLPSERTLRRKLEIITHDRYTTGSAINRRTNESARKGYQKGRPAYAPGEEFQTDSTLLDVMVRGDNGEPFRPTMTTFIDKATHCIPAAMVTDGLKGVDLSYLLAKTLSIPEARPGPNLPFNLNELRRMPWAELLIESELDGKDTGRPIIVPSRIMMDNGREYQSDVFLAACHLFCIDTTDAAPATGTDKPEVERAHRTVKDMFVRYLPGFTGGDPGNRGKNIEKRSDLISVHTLAYVLDLWIRHIWNNLETDALVNRAHPGRRYSPNTMYEALTYRTGCLFRPVNESTYIALLPAVDRVLGRRGITINYRRYDSPAVDPYRGQPSGNKLAGDQWQVHYDPNNPAVVWLHVPELPGFPDAGSYIECPWVNSAAFDAPFERASREAAENLAQMGYQIAKKDGHSLSRRLVRGAFAAAEKEFRAAEKREARERLAEEQGMARPTPTTVVRPADPSQVWAGVGDTGDYDLFDPDAVVDAGPRYNGRNDFAEPDSPATASQDGGTNAPGVVDPEAP